MKFRPVTAESFHADRQRDRAKLTVTFRNFAKVPDNPYPANVENRVSS